MKIPLTQGKYAIIDDSDFELVKDYKWYAHKNFHTYYAETSISTKTGQRNLGMHRLLLGDQKGILIDHINHNGLDNRRSNLRLCTNKQNVRNQRKRRGSSIYKGVSWHKKDKKWQSSIVLNGKLQYLGEFDAEKDAALMYNDAAIMYFGEYACLNKI